MHHLLARALSPLPPVPSKTPIYKGVQTDTANADLSTFTSVDIGVPHPKRLVILACCSSQDVEIIAKVNGNSSPVAISQKASPLQVAIFAFQVPVGLLATITVSQVGALRKVIGVYVAYPASPFRIAGANDSAATTVNAVAADIKVQAGGFLIYVGGQQSTLGAFTTTWSGPDAVTEDVDAQLEAVASYTMGRITNVTVSSDLDDLTLAASVSGLKRLIVMSLGPA